MHRKLVLREEEWKGCLGVSVWLVFYIAISSLFTLYFCVCALHISFLTFQSCSKSSHEHRYKACFFLETDHV